ncbi:MAG: hypothetical protein JXA10_12275, partial [Anaerolineae bacterium]|nr:hypothetical protein [Anaerolineae bacterium]
LPWIELLEHRLWLGRWAHQTLAAYQSNVAFDGLLKRLQETLRDSRCHHKRIGGTTVERLAEYVIEQVT